MGLFFNDSLFFDLLKNEKTNSMMKRSKGRGRMTVQSCAMAIVVFGEKGGDKI